MCGKKEVDEREEVFFFYFLSPTCRCFVCIVDFLQYMSGSVINEIALFALDEIRTHTPTVPAHERYSREHSQIAFKFRAFELPNSDVVLGYASD